MFNWINHVQFFKRVNENCRIIEVVRLDVELAEQNRLNSRNQFARRYGHPIQLI